MTNKGTYAAVKFDTATNKAIHQYIHDTMLPNAVRPDQLHTTLLYSRKHLPNYKPMGMLMLALFGTTFEFDVWQSSTGERCLVLKYTCDALVERHKYLMDTHEATYDFPNYTPHITFSYDIGNMDISTLPDVNAYLSAVVIIEEWSEDLNLDWVATSVVLNKT